MNDQKSFIRAIFQSVRVELDRGLVVADKTFIIKAA